MQESEEKYSRAKRAELRCWISKTAVLINRLKDQRKLLKNRRYPEFAPPVDVHLISLQWEFRHTHIAASVMRGKAFSQIEPLPQTTRKFRARVAPDTDIVRNILKSCEKERETVTV